MRKITKLWTSCYFCAVKMLFVSIFVFRCNPRMLFQILNWFWLFKTLYAFNRCLSMSPHRPLRHSLLVVGDFPVYKLDIKSNCKFGEVNQSSFCCKCIANVCCVDNREEIKSCTNNDLSFCAFRYRTKRTPARVVNCCVIKSQVMRKKFRLKVMALLMFSRTASVCAMTFLKQQIYF